VEVELLPVPPDEAGEVGFEVDVVGVVAEVLLLLCDDAPFDVLELEEADELVVTVEHTSNNSPKVVLTSSFEQVSRTQLRMAG